MQIIQKLLIAILIMLPVVAIGGVKRAVPVEIMADSLELKQKSGYAIFSGNVQVKHKEMRLGAEYLEVYYSGDDGSSEKSADSSSIQKIIAKDKVTIVYDGDTATGEIAIFNPVENTIILEGNVVMIRQGNVLKGNKLVYNTVTKSMKLDASKASTGRVKASFSVLGDK